MANQKSRTQRIAELSKAIEAEINKNPSQLKQALLEKVQSMLADLKKRPIPGIAEFEPDSDLDKAEQMARQAGVGNTPSNDSVPEGSGALGGSESAGQEDYGSSGLGSGPVSNLRDRTSADRTEPAPRKETEKIDPKKKQDESDTGRGKKKEDTSSSKGTSKTSPSEKPKADSSAAGSATPKSSSAGGVAGSYSRLAQLKDVVDEDGKIDKEKALDIAKQEVVKKILATPQGRIAVGIVIVVVLIFLLAVASFAFLGDNGLASGLGGSVMTPLRKGEADSEALVLRMKELTQPTEGEPIVEVVAPANVNDLTEWQNENGKITHRMDRRVLETIDYLVDQGWEKIVIGVLKTGGPDKISMSAEAPNGETEQIVTTSAYSLGQAMGIVALGKTSAGLTSCLGLKEPIPVQISWQETTMENAIRPIHEQLQVDMMTLDLLLGGTTGAASFDTDRPYVFSDEETDLVNKIDANLQKLRGLLSSGNGNPAALQYIDSVSGNFKFSGAVPAGEVWEKLETGMTRVFRALQVANMVGWEGSRANGCRLWKAYEARTNIRKLGLQILQMPVKTAREGIKFNHDLKVKQMVVFSPEDDINNGLSNLDVFPNGAVAVDMGGVSFDTTNKDNVVTKEDVNFVGLPMDNGILAKKSVVFLREVDGELYPMEGLVGLSSNISVEQPQQEFEALWDRKQESAGRVSYKNFVHIGF